MRAVGQTITFTDKISLHTSDVIIGISHRGRVYQMVHGARGCHLKGFHLLYANPNLCFVSRAKNIYLVTSVLRKYIPVNRSII